MHGAKINQHFDQVERLTEVAITRLRRIPELSMVWYIHGLAKQAAHVQVNMGSQLAPVKLKESLYLARSVGQIFCQIQPCA